MATSAKSISAPEHRWPEITAILLILALYTFLPGTIQIFPVWLVPAIGLAAALPLVMLNPHRLTKETRWSRWLSIGLAIVLTLINQVYVVMIIRELLHGNANGPAVLLTVLQVWVSNVIAFALVNWQLDKGGPIQRRVEGSHDRATIDFRFPQDGDDTKPAWQPSYFDYAYFSLSNMMAFSPTDVMPLTLRAKAIMGYQALTGFVLLALVISRAVNILT
ncbi:DUF1345 domain-containing protein [Glaciihabitans sp. dw_435]|uniref:DUF1345 domain-containing protein n=1 Tax=Glaciihabitans sp. dw_435 TaxID=2720081 RepID=UPI0027DE3F81|nr:DUF1345 domain-containing protein [Glaciihabitans sp. dw_435]